jgi:hypothetical protein
MTPRKRLIPNTFYLLRKMSITDPWEMPGLSIYASYNFKRLIPMHHHKKLENKLHIHPWENALYFIYAPGNFFFFKPPRSIGKPNIISMGSASYVYSAAKE